MGGAIKQVGGLEPHRTASGPELGSPTPQPSEQRWGLCREGDGIRTQFSQTFSPGSNLKNSVLKRNQTGGPRSTGSFLISGPLTNPKQANTHSPSSGVLLLEEAQF